MDEPFCVRCQEEFEVAEEPSPWKMGYLRPASKLPPHLRGKAGARRDGKTEVERGKGSPLEEARTMNNFVAVKRGEPLTCALMEKMPSDIEAAVFVEGPGHGGWGEAIAFTVGMEDARDIANALNAALNLDEAVHAARLVRKKLPQGRQV
jgi:hypothetical protein